MSKMTTCGYCGRDTAEPTGLHTQLYGLLGEFYREHRANQTWQHCHEWASRLEALVTTGFDPWHNRESKLDDQGKCTCASCWPDVLPRARLKVLR